MIKLLNPGGNSGIGYDCAFEIAKRKGTVHLVCRNDQLGNKAKEEIITQTGNDKIFLHILDLSQPQRVVEFTKAFTNTNNKLNVLVRPQIPWSCHIVHSNNISM